jgi:CO dehydrogenase/acetyl-CoA synthase delta subunit
MQRISIYYLNKEKGFARDEKIFEGENAFENAVKWGKENLEKFNQDMINYHH